jgi:hypothetical protein
MGQKLKDKKVERLLPIAGEQNLAYVEKENLYKKQEWMIGIE